MNLLFLCFTLKSILLILLLSASSGPYALVYFFQTANMFFKEYVAYPHVNLFNCLVHLHL